MNVYQARQRRSGREWLEDIERLQIVGGREPDEDRLPGGFVRGNIGRSVLTPQVKLDANHIKCERCELR